MDFFKRMWDRQNYYFSAFLCIYLFELFKRYCTHNIDIAEAIIISFAGGLLVGYVMFNFVRNHEGIEKYGFKGCIFSKEGKLHILLSVIIIIVGEFIYKYFF